MRINREPGPEPALCPQQLVFRKPFNCPPTPAIGLGPFVLGLWKSGGQLCSELASLPCLEHPMKNFSSETAE